MKRRRRSLLTLLLTAVLLLPLRPQAAAASSFAVRGVHLDLRTQVMTLPALERFAREAAAQGINTILMEWEATFPFERHAVLRNRYAYTPEEIRRFVTLCTDLGIDVIPLQNCFGHCEYILRHERYAALREDKKEISQVCPLKTDEAVGLFSELFAEIAALHPSPYIHIGADETRLLGHCKHCAAKVAREGTSALFVDYVNAMCRIVTELGKTPIIWGDMLLQHPEAVGRLPKELIVADWNYGWEPSHFGDIARIAEAGITVWGATALRSGPDNIYLTQWDKHLDNLATFLPYARSCGYRGMIDTSWSTSGHYGYTYDHAWEIIEMQPVRQVYPLAGFDLLQRAYSSAVASDEPFEPEPFIRRYARDRYGFDEAGAQVLVDYFLTPQESVTGSPHKAAAKIAAQLAACRSLNDRLQRLKPRANRADFEQLRLMLDIRIHYLRFKQAETEYESETFDASHRREMAHRMEQLRAEGARLRQRFVRLNGRFLKNPHEAFGAWTYVGKIDAICAALASGTSK